MYSNDPVQLENGQSRHGETDYYYDISWSDDSWISDCHAERQIPLGVAYPNTPVGSDPGAVAIAPHGDTGLFRHGFNLQNRFNFDDDVVSNPTCTNNEVVDCVAINLGQSYMISGTAEDNLIHKSIAYGTGDMINAWGSLDVNSGAKDNRFHRMRVINPFFGVLFEHYQGYWNSAPFASDNNVFANCIFEGVSKAGVHFSPSDYLPSDEPNDPAKAAVNSVFLNCTFEGGNTTADICRHHRVGVNNQFWNCIFTGFDEVKEGFGTGDTEEPDMIFDYCRFRSIQDGENELSNAMATGIQNAVIPTPTPIFVGSDFELDDYSDCIGNGFPGTDQLYQGHLLPLLDYDGDTMGQGSGYEIGAQEW